MNPEIKNLLVWIALIGAIIAGVNTMNKKQGKQTLSEKEIETERLNIERERLEIEKQRLKLEQERLRNHQ